MKSALFLALIFLSPSARAIDTDIHNGESSNCYCQRVHLLPESRNSCLMVPHQRRIECAKALDEVAGMNSSPHKYVYCHLAPKFHHECRSKFFSSAAKYRECVGLTEEQGDALLERVKAFDPPEGLREKCREERR